MITASRAIGFRSRAQSLVRFAESLKRAKTASGVVSLVRAHTPHTPRGRALTRRPGSLVRARSSAQASERSRTGVVGPCGGKTRVAQWANPADRTRHGETWAAWAGRERESADPDRRNKLCRGLRLFPRASAGHPPWEVPTPPVRVRALALTARPRVAPRWPVSRPAAGPRPNPRSRQPAPHGRTSPAGPPACLSRSPTPKHGGSCHEDRTASPRRHHPVRE